MRLSLPLKHPTFCDLPRRLRSTLWTVLVSFLGWASQLPAQEPAANQKRKVDFFESKIRPVLISHCYKCHSIDSKDQKGGLLLDTRGSLRRGGDSGIAIVPGKPEQSLLISALKYHDVEMPPAGKLADHIIRDFENWITDGAIDPRNDRPVTPQQKVGFNWKAARNFWSFRPPVKKDLPKIQTSHLAKNRIDYFVLYRLEKQKLEPAKRATNRELNRRITYDLVGLPPVQTETEIELLVDRLLASPAFGEKWARLWLDISRYAEDQAHIVGNNQALFYPNAYLFRDWVINAFNEDLPYDQFVTDQLAIDLRAKKNNRKLTDKDFAALGFIGLGPKYYRRSDLSVMADEWEDRIDAVSRGFLGLTVACARCHDHKYDPISTEDYYALAGVFASTEMYNKPLMNNTTPVESGLQDQKLTDKKTKNKDKKPKTTETVHIVRDSGKPKNLNVFIRGDVTSKGPMVKRRFLSLLNSTEKNFNSENSGRLELAHAITDKSNPLFARVIVNRVWAQLIGQPIVGTPSNFGVLGERPTHPDLLDDLSFRFMENGWSIKWLIREIITSSTYQQSSVAHEKSLLVDPANHLMSRMNRKRLSIEQWRDSILAVNNHLDSQIGGRSIDPADSKEPRRTIYSKVSRFQLNAMLSMFDFPDPNAHAAKRSNTISPLQKMFALNSKFLLDHSKKLAEAFSQDHHNQVKDRFISSAYQRLFQRKPLPEEQDLAKRFLKHYSNDQETNRIHLLQTLLISNEFSYID